MFNFFKKTTKNTFLLATGGTGGHVFPAIALGQHLQEKKYSVHLSTDMRGRDYIQQSSLSLSYSTILYKNLGNMSLKKQLFYILPSCLTAVRLLLKVKPKAVISFGGYPAFPVCIATQLTRTPLFIHEQNSVAGLVNRLFIKKSKGFMASFPQTKFISKKYKNKTYITGNFVRQDFLGSDYAYTLPSQNEPLHILALGGSQGALSLSKNTIEAIQALPNSLKKRIKLILQAPKKELDLLYKQWPTYKDGTENKRVPGEVKSFFNDMPKQLETAHLVVSRSGASAVWEILTTKRPAIFLPLATASNNHQYYNALYLEQQKSAWVLSDKKNQSTDLKNLLEEIFKDITVLKKYNKALTKFHNEIFKKNPLEFATEILQNKT